jgi:hypothetical protein
MSCPAKLANLNKSCCNACLEIIVSKPVDPSWIRLLNPVTPGTSERPLHRDAYDYAAVGLQASGAAAARDKLPDGRSRRDWVAITRFP